MTVKDDIHHLVDQPRRGPRVVKAGSLPFRLAWLDSRVLQHPFYGLPPNGGVWIDWPTDRRNRAEVA
jgi:hypothetical protein